MTVKKGGQNLRFGASFLDTLQLKLDVFVEKARQQASGERPLQPCSRKKDILKRGCVSVTAQSISLDYYLGLPVLTLLLSIKYVTPT